MKVNIGKNTIGDNDKMSLSLKEYGRSTHDLSYAWRSSMGVGTLVPFLKMVALPGDTFDISLEQKVLTHPTVGALFGNYKLQMDVFTCPIRLYNAMLHNNALNIGMNMKSVKLPKAILNTSVIEDPYFPNINRSSLYAYLGKKYNDSKAHQIVGELAYIDTFKNYYANKQEKYFYMIGPGTVTEDVEGYGSNGRYLKIEQVNDGELKLTGIAGYRSRLDLKDYKNITTLALKNKDTDAVITFPIYLFTNGMEWQYGKETFWNTKYIEYTGQTFTGATVAAGEYIVLNKKVGQISEDLGDIPRKYELEDIDKIREYILSQGSKQIVLSASAKSGIKVLDDLLGYSEDITKIPSANLGGLILKTHMSDIFNNWVNSEWVDGENGISNITKIDTSGGSFNIDTLNLAQKVYNMLNRIALSGGTYKDWIETVYTTDYYFRAETPIYEGGMSATIDFAEVVSNSASSASGENEPLGTLAGRGFANNEKGGRLEIKVNEPSYILGLVSITPYVDYSQGNDWDIYLDTLDDLHKPQLDGIGYQDLLQRHMHAMAKEDAAIGKQPAWLNYMTNYNKTFANFAAGGNESFMVLNRIYEINNYKLIENATTYINPRDYTYIFAENNIENQDFWVQIGVGIEARRVMSAKQIPMM